MCLRFKMKETLSSYICASERYEGFGFTGFTEDPSSARLYKQNLIRFSPFRPVPSFSLLAYAK